MTGRLSYNRYLSDACFFVMPGPLPSCSTLRRHGLRRLMLLNQLLRRAVVVLAGELAEAGDCDS